MSNSFMLKEKRFIAFCVGVLMFRWEGSDFLKKILLCIIVYYCNFRFLAHLGEVDAEDVGVVLPGYVDLWLRASTFPLDFCTTRQSERRLLGDQLQKRFNTLVNK